MTYQTESKGVSVLYRMDVADLDAPVVWYMDGNCCIFRVVSRNSDPAACPREVRLALHFQDASTEDCEAVCEAFHLAAKYRLSQRTNMAELPSGDPT